MTDTIDVIAKAREVIKPVSSAELIHDGHSDDWKLGFDVAAKAMAIEATRAVTVLEDCIKDLAATLRPFSKWDPSQPWDGALFEDDFIAASATLTRWGLEK